MFKDTNKPIFILSLPRMGSTSVSEAMKILGFSVSHFCPITNINLDFEENLNNQTYDCYVSSILTQLKLDGFKIYLDRSEKSWIESMLIYNNNIFQLKKDFNEYKSIDKSDSIVYNVSEGWEPLCLALNKEIPKQKFPHINKKR